MNTEKKTKGKSPGFWFFTGDWLKDPELRFCSIFARGLLVDLLCYMFEAKHQGYLCWDDGTPRTDEEIADAVSGGDRAEKIAAIQELERKGVLSRDKNGVLYSRRMARLAEISQTRKQSGSKGGSKTQAKVKQTTDQTVKQNTGVSVSVSVSDSDSTKKRKEVGGVEIEKIDPKLLPHWERWCNWILSQTGNEVDAIRGPTMMMDIERRGIDKAIKDINFTIGGGWSNRLLDSDTAFENQRKGKKQNASGKDEDQTVTAPKLMPDPERLMLEDLFTRARRTSIPKAIEMMTSGKTNGDSLRMRINAGLAAIKKMDRATAIELVPAFGKYLEKEMAK